MKEYRVVQIGIGPLGRKMFLMARSRKSVRITGAVDRDPKLIGQDLGEICGDEAADIRVFGSLAEAISKERPDIALVTTVSDMQRITPLLEEIVSHGIAVVSTCEELSYAWKESPELASKLDMAAKRAGVAILGTGVNPGFLMDSLPAFLTGVCKDVQHVRVSRYQDAQYRRIPFQQKIGAGLSMADFEEKQKQGTLRHVGLTESMQFVAEQLGWTLDSTEDVLLPVVTDKELHVGGRTIAAGHATGVRQVGKAYADGEEKIELIFQAAIGEPESFDEVLITGTPDISSRITNGVNGDIATCAITLNAVPSVLGAQPGLRTMADVPMVSCRL